MVTCNLFGRMGNQICQIAATMAYAWKHNLSYFIPQTTTNPAIWPATYFSHLPYSQMDIANVYNESPNQAYQEIPYYPTVKLNGHFQSYKYYHGMETKIAMALKMDLYSEGGFCSVHVRRGDYLNFPEIHPVVTGEYILKAMDHIIENTRSTTHFMVFSDDIPWCRELLGNYKWGYYKDRAVHYITPDNCIKKLLINDNYAWHDFQLMANCRHNIISNSTFSLLPALINSHTDKIVIAPNTWTHLPASKWDTSNFIPETWLKM